jgi:hypothetical protein
MSSENRISSPESAINQVGNINALVWELNRMGYRAGLHRTHPAADWLAECGVQLSEVWKTKPAVFPRLGKKRPSVSKAWKSSKSTGGMHD